MNTENILAEYDSSKKTFESFTNEIESSIRKLLSINKIKVHQVSSRLKEREKLEEKIIRKQGKYKELKDITDIAGIRIITYFTDEIDSIANILSHNFHVDIENSIDKRKLESDRFGYMSLHYVIGLKEKSKQSEKYQNMQLEIQIRSILQHSWAEIEHDLGYKGSFNLPSKAKRTFHRVAALLESADLEFLRLRNTIENYGKEVQEKVNKSNKTIILDITSLEILIRENELMVELDQMISTKLNLKITDSLIELDSILTVLKANKIITNIDLLELIKSNKDSILNYTEKRRLEIKNKSNISQMSRGLFLYYLTHKILNLK